MINELTSFFQVYGAASQVNLASKFSVSAKQISVIVNNKQWKST